THAPAGNMKRLTNRNQCGRTNPTAPNAIQAATIVTTSSSAPTGSPMALMSAAGVSFNPHARLRTVVRRQEKNTGAVAGGGEDHPLGKTELHLARREIRDHWRQSAHEVFGTISGLDACEHRSMAAFADVERQF